MIVAPLDWAEKGFGNWRGGCWVMAAGVVLVAERTVWSRGQSSALSSSRVKALAPLEKPDIGDVLP